MSMITCPECSNEISNSALSCPKCGYINKSKNNQGFDASWTPLLSSIIFFPATIIKLIVKIIFGDETSRKYGLLISDVVFWGEIVLFLYLFYRFFFK
jgi:uncharacterized paraquat-inducible protein A